MTSRISFWDSIISDISPTERNAINSAADSIDQLKMNDYALDQRISAFAQRIAEQQKVIEELRAVLHVVVQALGEGGASEGVLEARIEAALDALQPKPAPTPPAASAGGDPYRGGGPAAPREVVASLPVREVACCRCAKWFPENQLNIIEEGMICDLCLNR
jgi:uncharacterized coiled-coil protein SlyX